MSQAPHVLYAVLLQDCRQVRLGHVVGKGAVAKDAGRVALRRQFFVPADDTLGQGFNFIRRDGRRQAGHQYAVADGVDCEFLFCPQMPQISADEIHRLYLRSSATSADK